jgi:hypothetical protein
VAVLLRPGGSWPRAILAGGLTGMLVLLLIPRSADGVTLDRFRIVSDGFHCQSKAWLPAEPATIPLTRLGRSVPPRLRARRLAADRAERSPALIRITGARAYFRSAARHQATQLGRTLLLFGLALAALPLLCWLCRWSFDRRTQGVNTKLSRWVKCSLGGVAVAALAAGCDLSPKGSELPFGLLALCGAVPAMAIPLVALAATSRRAAN